MRYEGGEQAFVVLQPSRVGGDPTIGHSRLSTQLIADVYWECGADEVSHSYELTPGEIVVAVWYEARYGTRTRRKRWKEWLEKNDARLWSPSHYGTPDMPPTKDA